MTTLQAIEQAKTARRQNIAAYREKMYHKLILAESQLEVWVREATVTDLMLLGSLPQSMLNAILAQAEGKAEVAIDLNAFAGSKDFGALVNAITICCAVEPPIAEKGDDDHLAVSEIPAADRMQVFSWANREVAANAEKFRSEAQQPVTDSQPGGDLRVETVTMDELRDRMGMS